ncbi:MAG: tRNA (adenosine(37)-N6)-threonylcarbamoyltransferase complex dimerization subunit type 1 TsaB [Aureliella sp.]
MLHLAIECSALAGSVALLQRQTVVAERLLTPDVGSVQSLAPTIAELLAQFGPRGSAQVELISVTNGPGSFTGLRAGLATAKMLGLAWQIPLVAVDTLQVIAARGAQNVAKNYHEVGRVLEAAAAQTIVVAVLNAYRKQVFAAAWRIPSGSSGDGPQAKDGSHESGLAMIPWAEAQVLDAPLWQAQPLSSLKARLPELSSPEFSCTNPPTHPPALPPIPCAPTIQEGSLTSRQIWVAGPGLRNYTPRNDCGVNLIDESQWDPIASWVGRLGWQHYLAGQAVSAEVLLPNYVRGSAAEETRNAMGI